MASFLFLFGLVFCYTEKPYSRKSQTNKQKMNEHPVHTICIITFIMSYM